MHAPKRPLRILVALSAAALASCSATVARPPAPPADFQVHADSAAQAEAHEPIEVWPSLKRDLAHSPKRVWDDGRDVFTDKSNLLWLLGAGAYALASEAWEDNEKAYFDNHTLFSNGTQDLLGALGNGLTLYAGTLTWYLWAAAHDDVQSYEASKTVFSALTVTAVTTTLMKSVIQDSRPSGGSNDFPSGHASQSMTMAAALDELYGPKVGWPAYGLAFLVGLQRLDTEKHDTGSVVFGWVLGYVVGHAVAAKHAPRIFGMDVGVSADPENGALALSLSRNL